MSLVFSNISKTYSNNKTATLKDINLKIGKGEFVCIVGKSGCGKSTLINLIGNQLVCKSGEIKIFGKTVKEDISVLEDICIVRGTGKCRIWYETC